MISFLLHLWDPNPKIGTVSGPAQTDAPPLPVAKRCQEAWSGWTSSHIWRHQFQMNLKTSWVPSWLLGHHFWSLHFHLWNWEGSSDCPALASLFFTALFPTHHKPAFPSGSRTSIMHCDAENSVFQACRDVLIICIPFLGLQGALY